MDGEDYDEDLISTEPDAGGVAAEERSVLVPEGLEGERLDVALTRLFGLSRSRAVELIGQSLVAVDGKQVGKSERLFAGSLLEVTLPSQRSPVVTVQKTPVEDMGIVYDDDDIVVVDKPAAIAAHPSVGWTGPTVVGALAAAGFRISTSGAPERQGIVQRLDVGTSGLMVVAKSERAYSVLKNMFRNREVAKTYHSLVQGHPDPMSGTIEAPIGRHPKHDWKFAVMHGGRHSVTHYEVVEAFRAATLLEISLETGRTHQIRVHFSALHHPCVGDITYGADPKLAARLKLERQWLHASKLKFEHPISGEEVEFQSGFPDDLANALAVLRSE